MQKPAYRAPKVLKHQPIRFETSQSWNRGRGPVAPDKGKSDGDNHKHEPYDPKKNR
ncbi:hypothetical protein [Paenibacillus sp. LHD-38]|uniref:hypothetical protein n=1 Tax=Paenibacillus sp. LHD-38 TaxID=3072143 RepID=UPI00280F1998|nr:hypothetical protein [Paenibacillus sp. LHD-38]MDQ8737922.1 hypothetical protein [Paenibacillus sp. LHD-38]